MAADRVSVLGAFTGPCDGPDQLSTERFLLHREVVRSLVKMSLL